MRKYFDWVELVPLTFIGLCFVSEGDMVHHTKKQIVGLGLSLLLYVCLYSLMIYAKINKYIALIIAFILSCGICVIRRIFHNHLKTQTV
jgi:heme/copper-type cytochrome/quinol oxidase subunit 4